MRLLEVWGCASEGSLLWVSARPFVVHPFCFGVPLVLLMLRGM